MIALPSVAGPITAQEYEVWRLLAEGYLAKEIADRLSIARQTQEKHRYGLYRKLGVNSPLMAALQAVRHGVISLPPRGSFVVSQPQITNRSRARQLMGAVTV